MAKLLCVTFAFSYLCLCLCCPQHTLRFGPRPASTRTILPSKFSLRRTFISREVLSIDGLCSSAWKISQNSNHCCKQHALGCEKKLSRKTCSAKRTLAHGEASFCCSTFGLHCPKPGDKCTTVNPCVNGDCVFSHLMYQKHGRCMQLQSKSAECSVDHCALHGANSVCTVGHLMTEYATCGAWHEFVHASGSRPCSFFCTKECWEESLRPLASNGELYCTDCALKSVSCSSGFEIFGPIAKDVDTEGIPQESTEAEVGMDEEKCLEGKIEMKDAYGCCKEFGIGCLQRGDSCSTLGSMMPMAECESPLSCVIADFGFPATDIPNSGSCLDVGNEVVECSVDYCSKFGKDGYCRVKESLDVTRCGNWKKRSDGNAGPDCMFACSLICLQGPSAPLGSDGKRYCSECQLKGVSCSSDFEIFGPVEEGTS